MDLSKIKKVLEVTNAKSANAALAKGWVILATASGTSRDGDGEFAWIKYSLGWPHDDAPVDPEPADMY